MWNNFFKKIKAVFKQEKINNILVKTNRLFYGFVFKITYALVFDLEKRNISMLHTYTEATTI